MPGPGLRPCSRSGAGPARLRSAESREEVVLGHRRIRLVEDAHEELGVHDAREDFLAHLEEEDVVALAGVRRERRVLAPRDRADVDPRRDELVGRPEVRVVLDLLWPLDARLLEQFTETLQRGAR